MHKRIYIFILAFLFFIGFLVLQLFFSKGNIFEQSKMEHLIKEYEYKVDSLKGVIEEYKSEVDRLQNDSLYKEEILRTKYGMSRDGEKVFQMVKPGKLGQ